MEKNGFNDITHVSLNGGGMVVYPDALEILDRTELTMEEIVEQQVAAGEFCRLLKNHQYSIGTRCTTDFEKGTYIASLYIKEKPEILLMETAGALNEAAGKEIWERMRRVYKASWGENAPHIECPKEPFIYDCWFPGIVFEQWIPLTSRVLAKRYGIQMLNMLSQHGCKAEKWEQEYKEAVEKADAMGLPALTGMEKQVQYAVVLRNRMIKKYERKMEYWGKGTNEEEESDENLYDVDDLGEELSVCYETIGFYQTTKEELADVMNYILFFKTNAGFWIDSYTDGNTFECFIQIYRDYRQRKSEGFDEMNQELMIKLTAIPECENKKTGTVELNYKRNNKVITALYIRDNDFIRIVEGLHYMRVGYVWHKDITEYTGQIDDCAAELGSRLLMAGFTVRFMTEKSKQAALSGTFIPEKDRWIKYNSQLSGLSLTWATRDNELHEKALKLPSARQIRGAVFVEMEFYREVRDFAEANGFSVSRMAREEIEKYIETKKYIMDGHGENFGKDKISD